MIFFTSDTHFRHAAIIKHCNRPFSSIEEHDATLIFNWNKRISDNDDVYFLGDFGFGNRTQLMQIRKQLRGRIHFIMGNHDKKIITGDFAKSFIWVKDYYELKVKQHLPIVLFHFPLASWNHSHHGSLCCHGHCHGNINNNNGYLRFDVGVDTNNFEPVSYEEVRIFKEKRQKGFVVSISETESIRYARNWVEGLFTKLFK